MTQITELPDELLLQILAEIPIHQRVTIAKVSQQFAGLAQNPSLWLPGILAEIRASQHPGATRRLIIKLLTLANTNTFFRDRLIAHKEAVNFNPTPIEQAIINHLLREPPPESNVTDICSELMTRFNACAHPNELTDLACEVRTLILHFPSIQAAVQEGIKAAAENNNTEIWAKLRWLSRNEDTHPNTNTLREACDQLFNNTSTAPLLKFVLPMSLTAERLRALIDHYSRSENVCAEQQARLAEISFSNITITGQEFLVIQRNPKAFTMGIHLAGPEISFRRTDVDAALPETIDLRYAVFKENIAETPNQDLRNIVWHHVTFETDNKQPLVNARLDRAAVTGLAHAGITRFENIQFSGESFRGASFPASTSFVSCDLTHTSWVNTALPSMLDLTDSVLDDTAFLSMVSAGQNDFRDATIRFDTDKPTPDEMLSNDRINQIGLEACTLNSAAVRFFFNAGRRDFSNCWADENESPAYQCS